MSTVALIGGILLPKPPPPFQVNPAFTTLATLTASTHKAGYVFRVPKTGNTKAIGFRIGSITTAQDLRISFQDVSATDGNPDGTEDQSVVLASGSLVANGWNTTGTITRAVTRGDLLAVVIQADSGTPSLQITVPQYYATGDSIEFPYAMGFTTAWGTKLGRVGSLSLQYDDNSYAPIDGFAYPYSDLTTIGYNTTSTFDEYGVLFQLPFGGKVNGAWMLSDIDGDAQVLLYDSDGTTVMATATLDKDQDANGGRHYVTFPSEVVVLANTSYRLVLKPTTTTTLTLFYFAVNSAALLDMCDLGQLAYLTKRADAGAWTDVTTQRPWMGVQLSAIDVGASAVETALPFVGMTM